MADDDPGEVPRPPDVVRRLALLWDPPTPSARGRRPRFVLADVVQAGITVALDGGLEALSMRRVAAELGVGAMSLYTYVPGRAELIDLMIDRAYGELDLPVAGMPWRAALDQYARQFWQLYLRHPWLLQTTSWRTPLAPHVLDAEEAGLRTLIDTPLTETQVVDFLGLVNSMVQGLARGAIAEAQERASSGQSWDDYWTSVSSFWQDWFDTDRYPVMTRVWNAGAFEKASDFESILERLLDAVEGSIARARTSAVEVSEDAASR